ncbi:hypothetical protein [Paraburkholderia tagetis]|uniref:hypothetical protein n=1 Tax=Paraburkholderia tagetis TaxID=2913261 RepID=UPI003B75BA10
MLTVAAVLAVPMAMTSPATLVLVSDVLSQRLRATGVSVSYYVATVIFGSFARFFSTLLIHMTGNANAPAFYIIGCGLLSLGGLAMVQETLGRRLKYATRIPFIWSRIGPSRRPQMNRTG